jgi:two-component system sensor histidine kinase LytS
VNYPDLDILFHWLTNTPELLQRACVVVVATYLAIRLEWFRRAMRQVAYDWRSRFIAALFFGALAIFGTYNGIVLDPSAPGSIFIERHQLVSNLQNGQAILSFRDMLVMSAGLAAGPWVGLGAGLIAGWQRYQLGSFVGMSSGLATAFLGLMTGMARQLWSGAVRPHGTLVVVLLGSAIQKLIVVLFSQPQSAALAVIQETIIPEVSVNCFGCLLFLSVLKDLERERLQTQAQQAELRALQAQVEPHFINNTLNAIKALIRVDPEQAADYVVKLARFLDTTRLTAKANSIRLGDELAHLQSYLAFQQLRFPGAFNFQHNLGGECLDCQVPPRCLLTLAENALLHGSSGSQAMLNMRIDGNDAGENLILRFSDNGCGLSTETIENLGKQPVISNCGSGNGLLQLNDSLQLAFAGAAKLDITNRPSGGCEITLNLPKRKQAW